MSSFKALVARGRGLALLLTPLMFWACGDESNPEAPSTPTVVSFTLDVSGDLQDAFQKADNAHVRVAFDGAQPVEETVDFDPAQGGSFEVDLASGAGNALVTVQLRRGTDVLFRGSKHVSLEASQTHALSLSLSPEIAELRLESPGVLDMLGETVQLEGSARFATGDAISGIDVTWSTDATDVELSADGAFRAFRNGTFDVTLSAGGLTATGQLEVAAVASVTSVTPSVVPLGEQVVLTLEGFNLFGATGVSVCGTADIDHDALVVAEDGRSLTVPVRWERHVAGSEALQSGAHCVRVETPQGEGEIDVQLDEPVIGQVVASADVLELDRGQTTQLELEVYDDQGNRLMGQPVAWSSSAPTVIAVDQQGVVTALGGGKATITATVLGVTASVDVFVNSLTGGTATMSGTVETSLGVGVEGVMVEIQGAGGAAVTTTDANGDYSFTGLPEGAYHVRIVDTPSGYAYVDGDPPGTYLSDGESSSLDLTAIVVATVSSGSAGSLAAAFASATADPSIGGVEIEPGIGTVWVTSQITFEGNQDFILVGNGAAINASGVGDDAIVFAGAGKTTVRGITMTAPSSYSGLVFVTDNVLSGESMVVLRDVTVTGAGDYGIAFMDEGPGGFLSTSGSVGQRVAASTSFETYTSTQESPVYEKAADGSPVKVGVESRTDTRERRVNAPVFNSHTSVAGWHITMTRVNANYNDDGAYVEEDGPGRIWMSITSSSFNRNENGGLEIDEDDDGDVIVGIQGSHFDFNDDEEGLEVDEDDDGDLRLSAGNSTFNSNYDGGIYAYEDDEGDFRFDFVGSVANNNEDEGIELDEYDDGGLYMTLRNFQVSYNEDYFYFYESGNGDAMLTAENGDLSNGYYEGIYGYENGAGNMSFIARNVTAHHSEENGIEIGEYGDGSLTVESWNLNTSYNSDSGLYVYEYDMGDLVMDLNDFTSTDSYYAMEADEGGSGNLDITFMNADMSRSDGYGVDLYEWGDGNLDLYGRDVTIDDTRDDEAFYAWESDNGSFSFDFDRISASGAADYQGLYWGESDAGDFMGVIRHGFFNDNSDEGVDFYEDGDGNFDVDLFDTQIMRNRDGGIEADQYGLGSGMLDLIRTLVRDNIGDDDIDASGITTTIN